MMIVADSTLTVGPGPVRRLDTAPPVPSTISAMPAPGHPVAANNQDILAATNH
jgi:hypothetical protein